MATIVDLYPGGWVGECTKENLIRLDEERRHVASKIEKWNAHVHDFSTTNHVMDKLMRKLYRAQLSSEDPNDLRRYDAFRASAKELRDDFIASLNEINEEIAHISAILISRGVVVPV
jgi:translation initiation factor 2B subunit (eIF-2B alpha/beta/delta family)